MQPIEEQTVDDAGGLKQSVSLRRRLAPYLAAEWRLLTLTLVAMFTLSAATLARPWPLTIIVDSVLNSRPAPAWLNLALGITSKPTLLACAVAAMIGTLVVSQALALLQTYLSQLLGQRLVLTLRCDIYAKLQHMSLKFHDNRNVGDLIYRITGDANALKDIVTFGLLPIVINTVTLAFVAVVVVAMEPQLATLAVVSIPLLLANTIWFSRRVKGSSRGLARADSSLYTKVSEVLGSIRAVKAFGAEAMEMRRFEQDARESQRAYVRIVTLSTLGGLVNDTLAGFMTAAVVFAGALAVMGGGLTVGELLVFVAYLGTLQTCTTGIAQAALLIHRSYASAERVVEILDEQDERADAGQAALENPKGRLVFDDVSFKYDGTDSGDRGAALTNLSMTVEAGEVVALVGRSGAGKTTLLSLLMGFYRPQGGRILLDDKDLLSLRLADVRGSIALVLQDAIIFSASIGENISYGRPGASRPDVEAAAAAAGLHDVIASLPEGYDTQVGERGARLSGGQRQRISIARAFLKDAPILVLDEPTSNLDAATERQVFEALDRLARGRTTLIVAHRLTTARRADRIVVLDKGRLIEQGAHDDLLRRDGAYASLCRDQEGTPRVALAAAR
jgi:ATP-binding cassette subfamily B protein/subfamily B ATP-binding cassette protein MsbA